MHLRIGAKGVQFEDLVRESFEMTASSQYVDIEATWNVVTARLELALKRVREEIKHYPMPIPACDAHFNWLLEERASISQELSNAQALSCERDQDLIRDFMRSSARLDETIG